MVSISWSDRPKEITPESVLVDIHCMRWTRIGSPGGPENMRGLQSAGPIALVDASSVTIILPWRPGRTRRFPSCL